MSDSFDRFDDMAEQTIWPWIDDVQADDLNDDWYDVEDDDNYDDYDDFHDESMDGDHDSAMESAGWGTDEDYGYFPEGDDY